MLPFATKAAPALATGVLWEVLELIRFLERVKRGFLIPQNKVNQLIQHKDWLTVSQKKQILDALQTGGEVIFKPTKRQINGGFLGTLAAIGIPAAIELVSKLFGKGLSVPPKKADGSGLMVSQKPGLMPFNPPPFIGSWEGKGQKNLKKRERNTTGKK